MTFTVSCPSHGALPQPCLALNLISSLVSTRPLSVLGSLQTDTIEHIQAGSYTGKGLYRLVLIQAGTGTGQD